LTLGKIIKIVATRCQILRVKCTKLILAGAPPQTPLEELTALPQTPSWIKGPTYKGRGRDGKGRGGEEKGGDGNGRGSLGEERGRDPPFTPPQSTFLDTPLSSVLCSRILRTPITLKCDTGTSSEFIILRKIYSQFSICRSTASNPPTGRCPGQRAVLDENVYQSVPDNQNTVWTSQKFWGLAKFGGCAFPPPP